MDILVTGSSDHRFAGRVFKAGDKALAPGAVRLWDARTGRLLRRQSEPAEQIMAVVSDKSLSEQNKQDKVKAIHTATEEKIEPLLTPDQMEKWGEWKQKGRDRAEEQNEQQSGPAQDPNEKDPKEKDDSK